MLFGCYPTGYLASASSGIRNSFKISNVISKNRFEILRSGKLHGPMQCNGGKASCVVPDMMLAFSAKVEGALIGLRGLADKGAADPSQCMLVEILDAAFGRNPPRFVRGEKSCFPAGDLIISVCLPHGATMLTTNVAHFGPLVLSCGGRLSELVRNEPAIRPVDLAQWSGMSGDETGPGTGER